MFELKSSQNGLYHSPERTTSSEEMRDGGPNHLDGLSPCLAGANLTRLRLCRNQLLPLVHSHMFLMIPSATFLRLIPPLPTPGIQPHKSQYQAGYIPGDRVDGAGQGGNAGTSNPLGAGSGIPTRGASGPPPPSGGGDGWGYVPSQGNPGGGAGPPGGLAMLRIPMMLIVSVVADLLKRLGLGAGAACRGETDLVAGYMRSALSLFKCMAYSQLFNVPPLPTTVQAL